MCGLFVGSLIISIVFTPIDRNFSYFLLPTRMWELLTGGILVLFDHQQKSFYSEHPKIAELIAFMGLASISVAYFLYDKTTNFPGYQALLPCIGAALFISSQRNGKTFIGKKFATKVPVFIGKMSYSLYLWHWPVCVILMNLSLDGNLNATLKVIGMCVSIVGSVLSFKFVEPLFRSKERTPNNIFFPMALLTWTTLFLFALIGYYEKIGGIRFGAPDQTIPFTKNITANRLINKGGDVCLVYLTAEVIDELYTVSPSLVKMNNVQASKGWEAARFNYFHSSPGPYIVGPPPKDQYDYPSTVIFGNSHCEMYGPLIEKLALDFEVRVGFICADGNYGMFKYPQSSWDEMRLARLRLWKPNQTIWFDHWAGDLGPPWWYPDYDFNYAFGLIASNTARRVLIFGDVPALPIAKTPSNTLVKSFVYNTYQANGNFDFINKISPDGDYEPRRIAIENNVQKVIRANDYSDRFRFVELASYFLVNDGSGNQHLQIVDPYNGRLVYKDFGHLNVDGAARLEQLFRKEIFDQKLC